jgi:MFS family permease
MVRLLLLHHTAPPGLLALTPLFIPPACQGYYYSGILIGPAVAPALAGVLTEYVKPAGYGWRAMQWLLFAMGVVASLLCLFCFPETAHERGIDLIREERRRERGETTARKMGWWEDSVFVWLNPLAPLRLLMLPHILAMVSGVGSGLLPV